MLDTIKADRYAFFTGFFENFYKTDENLGTRISEEALRNSWQLAANMSPYTSVWAAADVVHRLARGHRQDRCTALIMHGTGDVNVPIDVTSRVVRQDCFLAPPTSRSRVPRTACCGRTARRSIRPCWTFWRSETGRLSYDRSGGTER